MTEAVAKTLAAHAAAVSIAQRPIATTPIFVASGDTISIRRGTVVNIAGESRTVPETVAIALGPNVTLKPGSDYVIVAIGSEIAASGWAATLAVTGWQGTDHPVLGGFHYAPGGNAAARAGGDDVPAINPLSVWDIGFRPACSDPRGMALVVNSPVLEHLPPFWVDIYPLNVDHLQLGTSAFGAEMADGHKQKPKGADGERVAKLDYATAKAIVEGHGKQLLSVFEFFAAAHGVTEKTAAGSKPNLTGIDAARTSRFGIMQATGNIYVWGHDGDPDDPRASVFGGLWDDDEFAGSRCAYVGDWPDNSAGWIGARGRSDHLQPDA